MDALTDQSTTPVALRRKLARLPEGENSVEYSYSDAIGRVKAQKEQHRILALKILGWVVHATRPLHVKELQHALAVSPGDQDMDFELQPLVADLTGLCCWLTIRDTSRETKASSLHGSTLLRRESPRCLPGL